MRIALTGASGFIGSHLCRVLKDRGHSVIAQVRATSRRDHIAPFVDDFVEGEHSDRNAVGRLLVHAEAVIHNSVDAAAFGPHVGLPPADEWITHLHSNLVGSLYLLRVSAPRPFVFVSSIAVHHDMSPNWEGLIDEEHPLRPSTDYGAYKAAVEAHLWAEHFGTEPKRHTAAIRPCAVYGIDPKLERSHGYKMIRQLRESSEPFTRPGGGKFVHAEDVAAAAVEALSHPEAAGRPFNLADCYARWADWAQIACEVMGIQREIDFSSPPKARNEFSKKCAGTILGVPLTRGREGIRKHLEELVKAMSGPSA